MSYKLEELNPTNPILLIDGKRIELSLITLKKEVIFTERYGSTQSIEGHLKENPTEIINIIFELILNKSEFKNSLEVFNNFLFSITSKESIEEKSKKLYSMLSETMQKSAPLIKNMKRYKDIQQIKGSAENNSPCYVVYYDSIAKRYGKSIDEFYELTLRQVHLLLKVIGDKSYEELEIQAALQGRKLKPRINFEDVSPEQEAENEAQAMEAVKELQRKYQEKQKKKQGQ